MSEFEEKIAQAQHVEDASDPLCDEHQDVKQCPSSVAMAKEVLLPAILESVPAAIEFVKCSLDELGCPRTAQTKVIVATDEIVCNIAKYAYGFLAGDFTICVSAKQDGSVVEVSFIDGGIAFNPLDAPQIDATAAISNRRIGGQGILIVRNIVDEIEYERKDGKNILRIRKHIEQ